MFAIGSLDGLLAQVVAASGKGTVQLVIQVKALYEVKAPQEERNLLEDEMITLKRDIINNLHFI